MQSRKNRSEIGEGVEALMVPSTIQAMILKTIQIVEMLHKSDVTA